MSTVSCQYLPHLGTQVNIIFNQLANDKCGNRAYAVHHLCICIQISNEIPSIDYNRMPSKCLIYSRLVEKKVIVQDVVFIVLNLVIVSAFSQVAGLQDLEVVLLTAVISCCLLVDTFHPLQRLQYLRAVHLKPGARA